MPVYLLKVVVVAESEADAQEFVCESFKNYIADSSIVNRILLDSEPKELKEE